MIEINSVIQRYFQIQLTDRACDRLSLLVRVSDDLRITLVSRQSGISDESDLSHSDLRVPSKTRNRPPFRRFLINHISPDTHAGS